MAKLGAEALASALTSSAPPSTARDAITAIEIGMWTSTKRSGETANHGRPAPRQYVEARTFAISRPAMLEAGTQRGAISGLQAALQLRWVVPRFNNGFALYSFRYG